MYYNSEALTLVGKRRQVRHPILFRQSLVKLRLGFLSLSNKVLGKQPMRLAEVEAEARLASC